MKNLIFSIALLINFANICVAVDLKQADFEATLEFHVLKSGTPGERPREKEVMDLVNNTSYTKEDVCEFYNSMFTELLAGKKDGKPINPQMSGLVRSWILDMLGDIGCSSSEDILNEAIKDDETEVSAILALAKISLHNDMKFIYEVLTDRNRFESIYRLNAYKIITKYIKTCEVQSKNRSGDKAKDLLLQAAISERDPYNALVYLDSVVCEIDTNYANSLNRDDVYVKISSYHSDDVKVIGRIADYRVRSQEIPRNLKVKLDIDTLKIIPMTKENIEKLRNKFKK